jgi:hypothetical protein
MSPDVQQPNVFQLRLVVEADDFDLPFPSTGTLWACQKSSPSRALGVLGS